MVQNRLRLKWVFVTKFDFCQVGMTTPSAKGKDLLVKKQTSIITNANSIAEAIRLAQCAHAHEPLVGGRAKACEVYSQKFVELMIECIKNKIRDGKWTRTLADKFDIGTALEKLMKIKEMKDSVENFLHDPFY